jgi:hypothetical protein
MFLSAFLPSVVCRDVYPDVPTPLLIIADANATQLDGHTATVTDHQLIFELQ